MKTRISNPVLTLTLFVISALMLSGCNNKPNKIKENVENAAPPLCEQTQSCGMPGASPDDPSSPTPRSDDSQMNFLAIDSIPVEGINNVHVDEQIIVSFNKTIDASAFGSNFVFSGTGLDLVQLMDEAGSSVQLTVQASSDKLIIQPSYSLVPNTRYDLTISTELTANDGTTLNAPFYLSFYTDSEIGIRPGTKMEFSWGRAPNPDGHGGSYYYEDEGYGVAGVGSYNLHYGLESFPRGMPESQRLYKHKHSFNTDADSFYVDYELGRYYYTTELDLIKARTYYFALDVCNQSYCTGKSDELEHYIP